MVRAARLIIDDGKNLILIKRRKWIDGKIKEFYTLPGGQLDGEETWEEAVKREAKEELNVEVNLDSLLIEEYNEELDKIERFYFATIYSGRVKLGNGPEFKHQDINSKNGTYEIARISKKEIASYNILPSTIKDLLVVTYI